MNSKVHKTQGTVNNKKVTKFNLSSKRIGRKGRGGGGVSTPPFLGSDPGVCVVLGRTVVDDIGGRSDNLSETHLDLHAESLISSHFIFVVERSVNAIH